MPPGPRAGRPCQCQGPFAGRRLALAVTPRPSGWPGGPPAAIMPVMEPGPGGPQAASGLHWQVSGSELLLRLPQHLKPTTARCQRQRQCRLEFNFKLKFAGKSTVAAAGEPPTRRGLAASLSGRCESARGTGSRPWRPRAGPAGRPTRRGLRTPGLLPVAGRSHCQRQPQARPQPAPVPL